MVFLIAFTASAQKNNIQHSLSEIYLDKNVIAAEQTIDTASIWKHLRALAHDSMMGRRPGTAGEKLTVAYLSKAFREAGLTPAYNNSFLQPVHLLHASSSGTISFKNTEKNITISDSSLLIRGYADVKTLNAPLVFVGYGITAPEFGWDDYKGKNVTGKVVIALSSEPQTLTNRSFGKKGSLTFQEGYGVKEEYARLHGAAGFIILSDASITPVQKWWRQKDGIILQDEQKIDEKSFFIKLSKQASEQLAEISKTTYTQWKQNADNENFSPVDLPVKLNASITVNVKPFTSYNVVGYIQGADPILNKECVVYSTHWDGYGIGLPQQGDSIYNAAGDNAGGISEMISIAKAMNALHQKPKRSVVFISSTAEENGKLGAEAYVRSPLFPLKKTVLAIGMDIFSRWGQVTSLGSMGHGYTTMDKLLQSLAQKRNIPYQGPQTMSWFASSDQYQFALRGIPAIFAGIDSKSRFLSDKQIDSLETIGQNHTPFDRIFSEWDLTSAAEEARLLFEVGVIVANAKEKPRWVVDNEFSRAAKKNK